MAALARQWCSQDFALGALVGGPRFDPEKNWKLWRVLMHS
jgi:hypothetical protein